jgi:hypothetical protein
MPSTKIDSKTVIPLGWMLAGFAAGIGPLLVGVAWVITVNIRLGRIEQKLGIPPLAQVELVTSAHAGGK